MGLWKIDDVSSEAWARKMIRRHRIITALEVLGMIAFVVGMWFLFKWAADAMHP